ncbi:hypothetical protein CH63R_08843 [Colletotrichum higginsianum IMI 349063]|uniref:Uncharacterized protein n=1 Tax=Colletotrichum higginsianum (strain IMI 349063) TaxID=759273 RepID=A0A1B7Y5P6_COLHI|nr:hypothetical protein CH63R_08843 [Colletotrichum higginsianum IMI 349063]OBR07322.1 hypothetical protein CH63R_08843 [Colletotrichum higginsianum IMI 349063]
MAAHIHIFPESNFAALALGLDPSSQTAAFRREKGGRGPSESLTAPHVRSDPMSLPAAAAALHRVSLSAATRFTEANDTS